MKSSKNKLIAFFVLTFALSWAVWVPAMLVSFGWPGYQIPAYGLFGALMPGVAAIIVTAVTGGRAAVGKLLGQVKVWRVAMRWYGVAIFLPLVMVISIFVGVGLWQGSPLPAADFSLAAVLVMMLIQTPNTLLEEIGWRGFALPRMAEGRGWLWAGLVLGVIWATWHLPYWASSPDIQTFGLPGLLLWALMVIFGSVVFTWLYANTRSVLITWLYHLSTNTVVAFLPLPSASMGSLWPQAVYTFSMGIVALAAGYSLVRQQRPLATPPAGHIGPAPAHQPGRS